MSIKQNGQPIRYIKRGNLEEEAKIIGNYYRDIINSYGVDCVYYKRQIELPKQFNTLIDSNNMMRSIYGYDASLSYELSSNMLTYMEVENDIFMLNKYGLLPTSDVNFYFDITDFATNFASSLGQYKEYPIQTINLSGTYDESISFNTPFSTEVLSGSLNVSVDVPEGADQFTKKVICNIADATIPSVIMKSNPFISKCFNYVLSGGTADVIALCDFSVNNTNKTFNATINGSALYYDLEPISKYLNFIKPEVGDVIRIDFPSEDNREEYEITEVLDKKLTVDGLNPLLHKYIFKCKAIRRIHSMEDITPTLDTDKFMDIVTKQQIQREEINIKGVSDYPADEDNVYGGYAGRNATNQTDMYKYVDGKSTNTSTSDAFYNLIVFGNGSSLYTDGLDLYFKNSDGEITKTSVLRTDVSGALIPTDLRYLKATDKNLYFMNKFGDLHSFTAVTDDSIYDDAVTVKTYNDNIDLNKDTDNFYKFRNTKTVIFCTLKDLYVRLGGNNQIYKLTNFE